MRLRFVLAAAACLLGAVCVPTTVNAHGGHGGSRVDVTRPGPIRAVLRQRASLSADFFLTGPPSGALATPNNGRTVPFPGQIIPGFSGIVDNGDGTFWGLPDNGFGAKGNSADFLLRLYHVTPDWETADGGVGEIVVDSYISLRDPDHHLTFPIINESTSDRLLTGGDFDIESVQRAKDGTLWIGEEFGPFLLHFAADGTLLGPPIDFIDGKSPQNPFLAPGEIPRVRQSRGFEAVAASPNLKSMYPIVEGSFADETILRRRFVYEFDVRSQAYTGRTWQYRTDADANVIGDAVMIDRQHMLLIERDDFEGAESVTKRLYLIDLHDTDKDGFLKKRLVVDLLRIANPDHVGDGRPAGGFGLGDPFSFPLQSVETLAWLGNGRILVGNDNNYPGSDGRVTGAPDDTELIVLELERAKEGPLVIGHRGASGYRPEHTLASYELAIQQCADFIEPDLVSTKDGVLVARHENEIGATTDVAAHPEFADRRVTKIIDGVSLTGWFTEDFTLAELKTLRANERIPAVRPQNTAYNGLFEVPTLQEVIDLAQRSISCDGEQVGIYPETKHPSYFDSIGLSLEEPLVDVLHANGYRSQRDPVYIQSFEVGNLKELSHMTRLPLVQLINCSGQPWDFTVAGDARTYADLVTRGGLKFVSRYADGIGVCKDVMIPRDPAGNLATPSNVIKEAHKRGLIVHGWTFRVENQFLPLDYRSSSVPTERGDLAGEITTFVAAGMDGFFTDNPDIGSATAANLAAQSSHGW